MAKRKVFSISNALTQGLEETIGSAQTYSGELQIDVIPIQKIHLDPDNPREMLISFNDAQNGPSPADPLYQKKMEEIESLSSIAASIKKQGIINPVTVYKYGENYRLIAGERRTLASLSAGKIDIQARILGERPDSFKISQLQWIENMERSDLSLWERIRNLKKLVNAQQTVLGFKDKAITVTRLSELIGCSKPHAMHYKAVMEADDDVINLIQGNLIRNLEKAALIAGIQDAGLRSLLADAAVQGHSLAQLKILLKQKQAGASSSRPRDYKNKGRVPDTIKLCSTRNIKVARIILDSLLGNTSIKHITSDFHDRNLADPKTISDVFKQLMKKLEEIHA